MNFFSKKETPKETAMKAKREARREVRSNQRDMDREIRELDRQEKQITLELKQRAKHAKNGTDPALKALAKQLVQVRGQRTKCLSAKAQMGAMGMHASMMASQVNAVSALSGVTDTMKNVNSTMNVQKTQQIIGNFQRENERMNIQGEMMDDVLMDAFDTDDVEEEADQVTSQVLAELGVEMDSKFAGLNAPSGGVMMKPANTENELTKQEQDALDDVLPDLKARLDAL